MDLTESGFYKTPRVIKGREFLKFLSVATVEQKSVNIIFNRPVTVIDWRFMNPTETMPDPIQFVAKLGELDVMVNDIEEWEFVQYMPDGDWKAIRMGSTQRIGLEAFNELFINQTFRKLTPVIFLHQGRFWHVIGLELSDFEGESCWFIYLKRQDSDFMIRICVSLGQKLILDPQSNSWSLDDPTEEFTDLDEIETQLEGNRDLGVSVSGVPMKLVRVNYIAKNLLFFVFKDENDDYRYYYSKRHTKLRIVTDLETLKKSYHLDHVKAMYVD